MQIFSKVKTDYKNSMIDKKPSLQQAVILGKWPFALGLLTFAIVWRLGHWVQDPATTTQTIITTPIIAEVIQAQELTESNTPENEKPTDSITEPEVSKAIKAVSASSPSSDTQPDHTENLSIEPEKAFNSYDFTIQPGGSLAHYFQKAKLDARDLQNVLNQIKHANHLKKIFPGQNLTFQTSHSGQLQKLLLYLSPTKELHIERDENDKYSSQLIEKPIVKQPKFGGGIITDSLYLTGKKAKLSDNLIMALAQIFEYDIDFALDIKPKDSFKVLYEDYLVEGEKIGHGPILAAQFKANNKTYHAIRYKNAKGNTAYFSLEGESLKKAFIRTPVEYTRISSHFNLKRKHPVLHKIRAHKGVDYAAPRGTPVKASGSGKVIFVGRKGGYGNTVILQHGKKYSTLYAHLTGFAKSMYKGKKINQGQVIGYVGSTGLASGPHLHYEFRINGVHKNPLTVPLPNGAPISKQEIASFEQTTKEYLALLEETEKVMLAAKE